MPAGPEEGVRRIGFGPELSRSARYWTWPLLEVSMGPEAAVLEQALAEAMAPVPGLVTVDARGH